MPYDEEIEIIHKTDGTSEIKVIRSKRSCKDVTKPFEEGRTVLSDQAIPNPGQQNQNQIRGTS